MDVCLGRTSMNMTFSESHSGSKNVGFMSECLNRVGPQRTTAVMCDRFVWSAATQKETRQESEYEGRQKWTSLFFLGDKQQWIFPTRPDRTRLNQTGPGFTRSNQIRARSMKQVLTGPDRTTDTDQNMVTLCYTLRHRGNSHTWLAQSGLVGSDLVQ